MFGHAVDRPHGLVIVKVQMHLDVDTSELGQVSMTETGRSRTHIQSLRLWTLPLQVWGLREGRRTTEVVDHEDRGPALLQFGTVDFGEVALIQIRPRSTRKGDDGCEK
jgi:hypothetical protein